MSRLEGGTYKAAGKPGRNSSTSQADSFAGAKEKEKASGLLDAHGVTKSAPGVESGRLNIKSFQPGEDWGWCYVDEIELGLA
jgi:hypothetical protein